MQNTFSIDPLRDCVLSPAKNYHGLYQLHAWPSDIALSRLSKFPGVWRHKSRGNDTEILVPRNVLDLGLWPGTLTGYPPDPVECTPSGLRLRLHQRSSVTFLRNVDESREGALLVAAAGLGKTHCALQANYLDGLLYQPGLVIGPNISRYVWTGESSDPYVHYGLKIVPLEGVKEPDPTILQKDGITCFFCHFELLKAWEPWIFAFLKPKWLVIDESHYLSNEKAERTRAARQIALNSSIIRRFGLTGTPLPNSRMDLWSQLAIVQPRQWGFSAHTYGVQYCGGIQAAYEDGGYWSYDGESNTEELRRRLAGTMLVYGDGDIDNELPPLERHVIPVTDISDESWSQYNAAQRDIANFLRDKREPQEKNVRFGDILVELEETEMSHKGARLRCLTSLIGLLSEIKQEAVIRILPQILAEHDRMVIFTWHIAAAEYICSTLLDMMARGGDIAGKRPLVFGPVDGEMKMCMRQTLAIEFGRAKCAIYVATIGAAGMSINELKVASAALFSYLHWNTARLQQAEKRVHREGSTAPKVDIYYLTVPNSVDDLFLTKLLEKARTARAVSECDSAGMALVQDLIPTRVQEGYDLDTLCTRLMAQD